MLPFRGLVDYESEVPTEKTVVGSARSEREPETVMMPAPRVASPATPGRAFYVPSPLPMAELKKHIARADDEVTLAPATTTEGPPSSAPTQVLATREPAKATHVPFQREIPASSLMLREPPLRLPSLTEFAPLDLSFMIQPGTPSVLPPAADAPQKSRMRMAAGIVTSFALSLLVAMVVFGIARGDVTRAEAENVTSALARVLHAAH